MLCDGAIEVRGTSFTVFLYPKQKTVFGSKSDCRDGHGCVWCHWQHLVFNSLTNCLGPRKLLHSGRLHKTKSSRELWAFLFNDFLLLTQGAKSLSSSGPDKLFSPKSGIQLKMYKSVSERSQTCVMSFASLVLSLFCKQPLFLNEVLVKMPPDPSSDEPLFLVSHIDRVYSLKTDTLNER